MAIKGGMMDSLAKLSDWVDTSSENITRDPEAKTWGRLAKVAEESGEVIKAYIGVTGQNPRKGFHGSMSDVKKELLDTAVTALAAYEHLDGNQGTALLAFFGHLGDLIERAGI